MAFSSQDGTDTQRAIVEVNWRRQMIDGIGQVYTPFAQLRGDVYDVGGVDKNESNGSEDLVTQEPQRRRRGARQRGRRLRVSLSVRRHHRHRSRT